MRRRHVLAIIILLIAGYVFAWHLAPARNINFLVLDKTVPETTYREHRAIFWVAEHRRFINRDSKFLNPEQDYIGYHPENGIQDTLEDKHLAEIDLLYLADTYGIYDYQEGLEVYEEKLPYEHQEISLLYGGISSSEAEAIKRFAEMENRFLIGEHNIFGYPTYLDPEATLLLQDLFGVTYNGWLTRYYANLDEVAFWLKELYSRIYGQDWDLDGPGMVFVREEYAPFGWNTDLIIVQQDQFDGPWPVLTGSDHEILSRANSGVPYLYWLEVLDVNDDATVLTYYDLPVNAASRETLRARGLPERFPAMIYYAPQGKAQRVYFAGDFADQLPALLPASLTGSAAIQRFISYLPGLPVEYRFYFQWYEPVLRNILKAGSDQSP